MKYPFSKNTIIVPIILLSLIWGTFFLQNLGLGENACYGIVPRYWKGLRGILFAPLFHSGWEHIINNSIPLLVLTFFLVLIYQRVAYYVIIFGWLITGLLVWLFADFPLWSDYSACHIGASGLVYVLASFLFFSGIFRKSIELMAVSLIVVFLYGSMIWGIFPEEFFPENPFKTKGNPISWESHLFGGITGLYLAYSVRKYGPQKKKYDWDDSENEDTRAEELWQDYLEAIENKENDKKE